MIDELMQTYRDAATVIAFLLTYFAALTIGRLLKRKAGVKLGVFYHLFCLTLAFYMSLAIYFVHANCLNYVGAASLLLSAAYAVALLTRSLLACYFDTPTRATILR